MPVAAEPLGSKLLASTTPIYPICAKLTPAWGVAMAFFTQDYFNNFRRELCKKTSVEWIE